MMKGQPIAWGELKTQTFMRIFPYNTNEDVAIDMGCSQRTVTRKARELGLKKDPVWLKAKWDKNRKMAHFANTLSSTRHADLTNFVEGGKKHRFKKGENRMSHEERSEIMKRGWVTRRKNIRRRRRNEIRTTIT